METAPLDAAQGQSTDDFTSLPVIRPCGSKMFRDALGVGGFDKETSTGWFSAAWTPLRRLTPSEVVGDAEGGERGGSRVNGDAVVSSRKPLNRRAAFPAGVRGGVPDRDYGHRRRARVSERRWIRFSRSSRQVVW